MLDDTARNAVLGFRSKVARLSAHDANNHSRRFRLHYPARHARQLERRADECGSMDGKGRPSHLDETYKRQARRSFNVTSSISTNCIHLAPHSADLLVTHDYSL